MKMMIAIFLMFLAGLITGLSYIMIAVFLGFTAGVLLGTMQPK